MKSLIISKADLQFGEVKGCTLSDASIWGSDECESDEAEIAQSLFTEVDRFYLTEQGLLVQVDAHEADYKDGPIEALVIDNEWTKRLLL